MTRAPSENAVLRLLLLRRKTAGGIHNRDAGMRVKPEIGLFTRHLIRENYGTRPETSSLSLQVAIIICGHAVSPAGR
jgi:hypothetical protein